MLKNIYLIYIYYKVINFNYVINELTYILSYTISNF